METAHRPERGIISSRAMALGVLPHGVRIRPFPRHKSIRAHRADDPINAMARTPDGYLSLGTEVELMAIADAKSPLRRRSWF